MDPDDIFNNNDHPINRCGEAILERMMFFQPMKWQAIMLDIKSNIYALEAFSEWLSAEWYEKILLEDKYPEFTMWDDDMAILDTQHELLASLN